MNRRSAIGAVLGAVASFFGLNKAKPKQMAKGPSIVWPRQLTVTTHDRKDFDFFDDLPKKESEQVLVGESCKRHPEEPGIYRRVYIVRAHLPGRHDYGMDTVYPVDVIGEDRAKELAIQRAELLLRHGLDIERMIGEEILFSSPEEVAPKVEFFHRGTF